VAFGDSIRARAGASTLIAYLHASMQVNEVDKLLPNVYNEVRAACVKVVLRK
jgi:hypothetical protein